jgi:creatinine amidohydrolase
MRIAEMNWMQIEAAVAEDDRCVLPIGSTERHGLLSLCVDAILAERVALEAAEPIGVPVYPVMPFGCATYFSAFPGSVSLKVETLQAVVRDLIQSFHASGFRRVLIVNGHGGNSAVGNLCEDLMAERPEMSIMFRNWWLTPRTGRPPLSGPE